MVGTVCIASILWWAGLRRVSDGAVLPLDFAYSNVRATLRETGR